MGIPEDLGFSNDQFRNRVGKAFGVMELQPGQVNWGVYNPQPYPVPSVCGCITSLQVVENSYAITVSVNL